MNLIYIGELVERGKAYIQTGPFGTQLKASEYVEHGIPVINVRNIGLGNIKEDKLEFLSETKAQRLKSHLLEEGDIVFARKGAVERHLYVKKPQIGWIQGSDCLRLRINDIEISSRFLSYYFQTQAHQDWMINLCSFGATMTSLNQDIICKIQIPVPSLNKQLSIIKILSAYDELIEVNNQRIKLLEETGRELYKEWFVRMRFPGYKKTKFNKGVPSSWGIKKVDSVFEILGGGTPSTEKQEYWDGDINWFTPTDITGANGVFLQESSNKISAKGLAQSSAKLFPAYSIMMTSRATIGAVGINTTAGCTNQGFITCLPNEFVPYTFLYFWILFNKEQFEMLGTGSTFLEITKGTFRNINILLPETVLIKEFHTHADPIFKQIEILQRQNTQLRQIRDRLLPRLISGKLQVKSLTDTGAPKSIATNETNTVDKKVQEDKTTKSNPYFQRRVLAAYIIDRLKDEPTFGHVKLMKLMYLCEHLAAIETASHYHRDAAGPYDNQMIRSIDSQLKKAQWFDCKRVNNKYQYTALPKKEEYKSWFTQYYSDKETGIESLLHLFGKEKTEKAEMVATLYEAWRDLKEKKQISSYKAIIHEVLNNWHESKQRISEDRWLKCLQWMKEKGWVK